MFFEEGGNLLSSSRAPPRLGRNDERLGSVGECTSEANGTTSPTIQISGENLHWHITGLKKGTGTVEVTYQPSSRTLTVLVHDNRRGTWAGQAYQRLAQKIEKRLTSLEPGGRRH